MKIKFVDEYLIVLAENKSIGKKKYPEEVELSFKKRIAQIKQANGTKDLREIKSLHFEKLKEKRYLGKYSIRINKAYRLIFMITKEECLEIREIEEINNHSAKYNMQTAFDLQKARLEEQQKEYTS